MTKSFQSIQKAIDVLFIFFHPDYTVGFGVTPNHAFRLAGFTAGRELHPALKIDIQLTLSIMTNVFFVNSFLNLFCKIS